jgi:hypothetical protein
MNKENQIEEMAELERLLRIRRMDIEKQGCDIWALIKKTESEEQSIADYLIGQGYRKASKVAEEIFAEIEEKCYDPEENFFFISPTEFAELKKKYTEEGK